MNKLYMVKQTTMWSVYAETDSDALHLAMDKVGAREYEDYDIVSIKEPK